MAPARRAEGVAHPKHLRRHNVSLVHWRPVPPLAREEQVAVGHLSTRSRRSQLNPKRCPARSQAPRQARVHTALVLSGGSNYEKRMLRLGNCRLKLLFGSSHSRAGCLPAVLKRPAIVRASTDQPDSGHLVQLDSRLPSAPKRGLGAVLLHKSATERAWSCSTTRAAAVYSDPKTFMPHGLACKVIRFHRREMDMDASPFFLSGRGLGNGGSD
jgi:hypothetical protein